MLPNPRMQRLRRPLTPRGCRRRQSRPRPPPRCRPHAHRRSPRSRTHPLPTHQAFSSRRAPVSGLPSERVRGLKAAHSPRQPSTLSASRSAPHPSEASRRSWRARLPRRQRLLLLQSSMKSGRRSGWPPQAAFEVVSGNHPSAKRGRHPPLGTTHFRASTSLGMRPPAIGFDPPSCISTFDTRSVHILKYSVTCVRVRHVHAERDFSLVEQNR